MTVREQLIDGEASGGGFFSEAVGPETQCHPSLAAVDVEQEQMESPELAELMKEGWGAWTAAAGHRTLVRGGELVEWGGREESKYTGWQICR